jgi:superfamily II DNA or RNA helicase
MEFARRFIGYDWAKMGGQFVRTPSRVFASATADRSVFRFHINVLADFKRLLAEKHIEDQLVEWVVPRDYEAFPYEYVVKPTWKARDYQEKPIAYLCQDTPIAKLVELQTGDGKSLISMLAIAEKKWRAMGVLKPKYIEKWQEDFEKTYEDIKDKILVIQGSKDLKALLEMAANDTLTDPIILLSNATYRNWLSEYEEYGMYTLDMGYACLPEDLFLHTRTGIRLVDENHEDFHLFFKLDTYTHVKSSIALTATLIHKDPFLNRMYEIMFPPANRIEKRALVRYADVFNVIYRFKNPEKIRTEEYGKSTYSHTAFEKSIIRHVPTMKNYFSLIKSVVDVQFAKDRKPGEKCLIYAATVALCTKLTEYLKEQFPGLDVRRYVEDDPYENIIEAEVSVSTLLSAGTALDIPNLSVVIMTTALDSVQGNIQALGRLRKRDKTTEVLFPGKTQFYFFTCEDIPKHVRYAEAKRILFQDRAASFNTYPTGFVA